MFVATYAWTVGLTECHCQFYEIGCSEFSSDLKATLSAVSNKKFLFTMAQQSLPTSDSIAYPSDCPMRKAESSIPHTETTMSHKIVIPHPRVFFSEKKPQTSSSMVSETVTEMKMVPQQAPHSPTNKDAMKPTKLCDLIKTEELFPRHGVSGDELYELEPHRNAMSVRRRSTQFYTLVEEEEDHDGKVVFSHTETEITSQDDADRRLPATKPVFNMAESIRRLYYPGDTWKHTAQKHTSRLPTDSQERDEDAVKKETDTVDSSSGSATKPLLRRIQSHPELTSYSGWQTEFDVDLSSAEDPFPVNNRVSVSQSVTEYGYSTATFSKPRSVPHTPVVSPKTLRKAQQGDSFLSRVAGTLQVSGKYSKKDKSRALQSQHQVVTSEDQQVVAWTSRDVSHQVTQETVLCQEKVKTVAHPEKPEHVKSYWSDTSTDDEEPRKHKKKSPVSGIINWGTKSKVKVTRKEQNAFSPTSF